MIATYEVWVQPNDEGVLCVVFEAESRTEAERLARENGYQVAEPPTEAAGGQA